MRHTSSTIWIVLGALLVAMGYALRGQYTASPPSGITYVLLWVISASASLPIVAAGVAATLLHPKLRKNARARCAAAALIVGSLLVWLLKTLVGSERPPNAPPSPVESLIGADRYAWPSGHALAGGAVSYCLWGTKYWPLAALWALLVGSSRVLLAAHYLGDVLAGFGLGILLGVLAGEVLGRAPGGRVQGA